MHYAWIIVGLSFSTQFVANAVGFYAFAVLLSPIQESLGATRAGVSMIAFSLSVSGAVMAPLLGRAVTVFPLNRLLALGALVCGAAFLAMSQATALWQLYLGYAIGVSFAMGTLSGVGASTLIVNWFHERRAFAIGLAGVGISLAGALMTPVTSSWVEQYGWRHTFWIFAGALFVLAPIAWWVAVTRPSERGDLPYGRDEADGKEAEAGEPQLLSTRELLRSPNLWIIGMSSGICFMTTTGVIAHVVTLGKDAGYDAVDAAFLLSAAAAMAAVAKLLFGWMAERTGERIAFLVSIALHAVGLIGLAELQGDYPALLTAAAVFGLGMGAVMPLMTALIARVYGAQNFGPVMGLSGPILIFFQATGAPALGWVYDTQGDYGPGLWVMSATLAIPAIAISLMRIQSHED